MGGVIINFAIIIEPSNPGYGTRAMVACDEDGEVIYSRAQHLGFVRKYSNHELSYKTLIAVLKWVQEKTTGAVTIHTEQEILFNQLSGLWECRAENLQALHREAKELLEATEARLELIPARENSEARVMCRLAANQARERMKGEQSYVA